jgi:hypothetical protein
MPRYQRLSILVSLVLFVLIVSHVVELPTRTLTFVALGVPTTVYLSGRWFIGVLLILMTGAGADSIVRSHPLARHAGWAYGLTIWGLPCTLVGLALVALPSAPNILTWLGGLALTGLLLTLIVVGQYTTVDPGSPHAALATWVLGLATYVGIFLFCTLIYGERVRSLLSATTISVLGSALAAELLRPAPPTVSMRRPWLYSLIVGLAVGEVAWALNHVSLGNVASGILFLLVFYVMSGLARQHLRARLAPSVIAEFIVVSILALGLVYVL